MRPNHQRFGYSKKQWEAFKQEARAILIEIAKARAMITYGDLASQMTTIHVEPYEMVLWEILGDISRDEDSAGRGMLSVLVVHKHGDMEPGYGFFELARALGRRTRDRTRLFVQELHRVHAYWSIT